jgi:EAL domain-containing protein (putative c-di-GMP-specific phosphodiesterase class I)
VSVNVVGHDFVSEGLLSNVAEILQAHQLEPGALALEVKERDVFDHPYGLVRERLETIKESGIGVLVDDFGNAHAALMTALEAWPPNVMKVYPAFVAQVATDAYEATVASMNTLRDWPIDVLKLDRSLLDRLFTDQGAEPLVDGLGRRPAASGCAPWPRASNRRAKPASCTTSAVTWPAGTTSTDPRPPSTSTSSSPSTTTSRRNRPA